MLCPMSSSILRQLAVREFLFCDAEHGRHARICSVYSLLMLWCAPAASVDIAPASARTVVEYKLTDRQLACLRDNAEAYRMAKRDPLLIPLNQCPKLPDNPILGPACRRPQLHKGHQEY